MFRTSLWFMKWGTLIGGTVAAASWLLFQQDLNGLAGRGIVAGLGSMVLNMLNGDGRNAAGGPRTRSRTRKPASRSAGTRMKKPKPWESFERHREWQYQEGGGGEGGDAQDVLANLMDQASKVVTENGWWEVAKGVFAGQEASEEPESSRGQRRKGNSKTR
ncbi:hypothetical protein K438DRAFT_1854251 [Mycena galopus ATCC 62051]|nr:hypothetical protein K438DRAFT_1854251 [Mycena galopus ATCC 62051]